MRSCDSIPDALKTKLLLLERYMDDDSRASIAKDIGEGMARQTQILQNGVTMLRQIQHEMKRDYLSEVEQFDVKEEQDHLSSLL